jgi:hypothetical protein
LPRSRRGDVLKSVKNDLNGRTCETGTAVLRKKGLLAGLKPGKLAAKIVLSRLRTAKNSDRADS